MTERNYTFSLVSLGCAKNLVNSEQMHHLMREASTVFWSMHNSKPMAGSAVSS